MKWTKSHDHEPNARQIEPECAPGLLPDGGSKHGLGLRPDHCAGRLLRREGLSRTDAPRPLQRPRQRQKAGLPEQPLRLAGAASAFVGDAGNQIIAERCPQNAGDFLPADKRRIPHKRIKPTPLDNHLGEF